MSSACSAICFLNNVWKFSFYRNSRSHRGKDNATKGLYCIVKANNVAIGEVTVTKSCDFSNF